MNIKEQLISIIQNIQSEEHLKHLLNIANAIYLDQIKVTGGESD